MNVLEFAINTFKCLANVLQYWLFSNNHIMCLDLWPCKGAYCLQLVVVKWTQIQHHDHQLCFFMFVLGVNYEFTSTHIRYQSKTSSSLSYVIGQFDIFFFLPWIARGIDLVMGVESWTPKALEGEILQIEDHV
jgi:hypothetical protein